MFPFVLFIDAFESLERGSVRQLGNKHFCGMVCSRLRLVYANDVVANVYRCSRIVPGG